MLGDDCIFGGVHRKYSICLRWRYRTTCTLRQYRFNNPDSYRPPNNNHSHMHPCISQHRISYNMYRISNRQCTNKHGFVPSANWNSGFHDQWNSDIRNVMHIGSSYNRDSLMLCHVHSNRNNSQDRDDHSQLRARCNAWG